VIVLPHNFSLINFQERAVMPTVIIKLFQIDKLLLKKFRKELQRGRNEKNFPRVWIGESCVFISCVFGIIMCLLILLQRNTDNNTFTSFRTGEFPKMDNRN
jgi:hypothetical protein